MTILDSSALMRLIKKEPGFEVVKKLFIDAQINGESLFIHHANFIEMMYLLISRYGLDKAKRTFSDLKSPFLGIVNLSENDTSIYAAYLKSTYKMSLGDAFGLAFTKSVHGTFWTADRDLKVIAEKEDIRLELIL